MTSRRPTVAICTGAGLTSLQKEGVPDMVISGSALFLMDFRCFMKFGIRGTQLSFEMHPCREFPASQDAFRRWKSSLPDISC